MVIWRWEETFNMGGLICDDLKENFDCWRHSNFSRADVTFVPLLIHALTLVTIFWTAAFPVIQRPRHLSTQLARLL